MPNIFLMFNGIFFSDRARFSHDLDVCLLSSVEASDGVTSEPATMSFFAVQEISQKD